MSKAAKKSSAL